MISAFTARTLMAAIPDKGVTLYPGYRLTWAEEFNGNGLPDNKYWNASDTGGVINNEQQDYRKNDLKCTRVENGKLILDAYKDPHDGVKGWGSNEPYHFEYSAGEVHTRGKKTFKYGRIDVSAKIPIGRGVWPAIWLMPEGNVYGGWPNGGEIDVMEYVWGDGNKHNTVYSTVHTKDIDHNGNKIASGLGHSFTLDSEFHLYSLVWKEDQLDMLFDNRIVFSFEKKGETFVTWPFDQPFYLIMNIAVGGSWGGTWGIDESAFPKRMEVDYVRYYEEEDRANANEFAVAKKAVFDNFIYEVKGDTSTVSGNIADNALLLPGCYPDPSICRVGNDYYLVNSSFAYFPGVPIWHSTDLKSWERLGFVLNRPSQLNLKEGLRMTGGIYAPDIKYNPHNKLFYMITTDVDGEYTFFVTTDDPQKGNWSEPTYLRGLGDIDPGFLFEENGKAYIVNNAPSFGKPEWDGHRSICGYEFDWRTGRIVGEEKVLIDGGLDKYEHPNWIEGPHLYHIGDTYYLMAAEGGTGYNHSEVLLTSGSPFGPFKPCTINPILTQRDLSGDRPNPITCTGHADLVQTPEGDWYAVFLGVRPYKDGHDVMGRETFIRPVKWENGQPVITSKGEVLTYTPKPVPPTPLWTAQGLADDAFFIRTPQTKLYQIDGAGKLILAARNVQIDEKKQPSVIGRWVTEWDFNATTFFSFCPETENDFAGLVLFQNDACYIGFGKTLDAKGNACLKLCAYSKGQLCEEVFVPLSKTEAEKKLFLKVSGDNAVNYTFNYSTDNGRCWRTISKKISADLISTKTAGGFTGTMVGIYATAQ